MAGFERRFVAFLFSLLDRFFGRAGARAFGDEGGEFLVAFGQLRRQRMVRRDGDEACAEQRVGAGGEYLDAVLEPRRRICSASERKPHGQAF